MFLIKYKPEELECHELVKIHTVIVNFNFST